MDQPWKLQQSAGKKFLDLRRSNPSNSALRGIQKVAASFRTPSDLIKFAAGYPKNIVAIQIGSILFFESVNSPKFEATVIILPTTGTLLAVLASPFACAAFSIASWGMEKNLVGFLLELLQI